MMNIQKASISFRIGTPQWLPEDRFRALLDFFEKYKGVTDEVTFFTSETHPPLPLATIRERGEIVADRMARARALGYRAGINILSTIGHHNENLPNSLAGDYQRMMDLDGKTCLGSFCPNDEGLREYIRQTYELLVAAKPDYIWIDDDVRLLWHMPIRETCFCDHCLAIFERETGAKYTRESLKKAFDAGSADEKLKLRKPWLAHNRATIGRLFDLIEKTVHAITPGLPLGFMTGDRFFEGYDFDRWAEILSGPKNAEVMWRPGGGCYTDWTMPELILKSHDIGRQVAFLPESVRSIQSEIENFPYQRLKKAAHSVALEAASFQAAGCTGAAFNVLSMYDEPLDEYDLLVAKLHRARPFYDLLAKHIGRTPPKGIYTGWNKDSFATLNLAGGEWLAGEMWRMAGHYANEVFEIGMPVAYSPDQACVTLLTGDLAAAMSDAEIRSRLASGVYLDGPALDRLNAMGYSKLTGFAVDRYLHDDCIEQLIDHPLNGSFVGRKRDGRQSFYKGAAAVVVPQNTSAQVLSRMVDYAEKEISPCASGVFENELGGRVYVAGYYPWVFLQNLSKSVQTKSILRWLAKGSLPGYIGSYHRINLWIREPQAGQFVAAMINTSMDAAENVELLLRGNVEKVTVYDMECQKTTLRDSGNDGAYRKFIIPAISPWTMRLVVTG